MAWYKKAHLFLLVKGRYVTKKWRKSIKGWKDSLQGRDKKHNSSKLQKKTNFTTTRSKHSTYLSKEPQKKIPTRHSYTWINFSNCIKLQAGIIQYHWGVYNILHKKKKKIGTCLWLRTWVNEQRKTYLWLREVECKWLIESKLHWNKLRLDSAN